MGSGGGEFVWALWDHSIQCFIISEYVYKRLQESTFIGLQKLYLMTHFLRFTQKCFPPALSYIEDI